MPGEGRGDRGRELQPRRSSERWRDPRDPRRVMAAPLLPVLIPGEFSRKEDDAWDWWLARERAGLSVLRLLASPLLELVWGR